MFLYFSYLSCRLLCAVVLFFFRKTTRPFNRVAFSLALSIRFFPFCCSLAVSVPPAFLRFVPPSAVLYSHPVSSALPFLPPIPSSSFYSLGELYPVNRGTLLVTVCNLTEDQTKHDLTQPPPFCPPCSISSSSPTPEQPYAFTEDVYVGKRTAREYMRDRKKGCYELTSSLRSMKYFM